VSAPAATERQYVLDRLRGLALLGVVLVNAPFLLTSLDGASAASMPGLLDRLAGFVTWTFFQAKSYVVFSFLFGYSLAILLAAATRRGQSATRVYVQRLLALLLLGSLHACLLFVGDILVLYALLGSTLLWLRWRSARTLLVSAGLLLVVQVLVLLALLIASPSDDAAWVAQADHVLRTGGFIEAARLRVQLWPYGLGLIVVLQGFLVAGLFCVGLVAGQRRLLAEPERHATLLRRVRFFGLLFGPPPQIAAGLLAVWPGVESAPERITWALLLSYPTAPLLSAGYIAWVALLPRTGWARLLEPDGRMSLSVYLGESLLLSALASGWGLGLFGLTTGAAFAVALAAWLLLLLAAHLWERRFGTGPAERMLRALTYAGVASHTAPATQAPARS
jgi:uncharacterized protein